MVSKLVSSRPCTLSRPSSRARAPANSPLPPHSPFRYCSPTVMTDVSDAALENGRNIITKSLTRIARKLHPDSESAQQEVLRSTFSNITTTTSAASAVESTDLVIEAIVENLETKQELFRRLDQLAPKETIFASNTSSLSIRRIAETCSEERQQRFAGFHAFNPVPQMKLVRF